MLNHMVIWDYWLTMARGRRRSKNAFLAGHTASEQEAFDRLLSRPIHRNSGTSRNRTQRAYAR